MSVMEVVYQPHSSDEGRAAGQANGVDANASEQVNGDDANVSGQTNGTVANFAPDQTNGAKESGNRNL